jgi:tetratricopeptide (TPR) repeat protein
MFWNFCGRLPVNPFPDDELKAFDTGFFRWAFFFAATPADDAREQAARIIAQIQRADYEGDRAAMQRGYDELKPFMEDQKLVSRIRYWRGFAQWRRAINGFNDAVDPKELEQNLNTALDEFKVAIEKDPTFVDAKVGTISCLGFLAFMNRKDQPRAKEWVGQILPLVKEAYEIAPDNPRLIWVKGPILWNSPPERGGGQDKAIQNYQRGLEVCSKIKTSDDPLEPSWGKPELMMSLAYCYLNADSVDVSAAERYARNALEIVPYWHYVRDILLPQIVAAKAKLQ